MVIYYANTYLYIITYNQLWLLYVYAIPINIYKSHCNPISIKRVTIAWMLWVDIKHCINIVYYYNILCFVCLLLYYSSHPFNFTALIVFSFSYAPPLHKWACLRFDGQLGGYHSTFFSHSLVSLKQPAVMGPVICCHWGMMQLSILK